ncbi:cardiolipin synthase [Caryophanon tenue]|uniref:Cardiolipin synthase n=1 Tax=Caryophanon tenue TaxID=33978 RepID=A0A1C0YN37_9BACL|nr:cardiolipin synthase [Caryophanon tenue]OCS88563.1 cardiolipin synthase [Caryophanon tenue]
MGQLIQSLDLPGLILLISNMFFVLAVVFIERKHPSSAWAWMFVLIFAPFIGFIGYLLLGRRLRKKHLYRFSGDKYMGLNQLMTYQVAALKDNTYDFHDVAAAKHRDLIYMHLTHDEAVLTQDNDVTLYTDGHEKFAQLLRDIEQAKHHIHMQYYIFRHDDLGQQILRALEKKAKQGVEVRFLYDAIGSNKLFKRHLRALREAGGFTEVFFPSVLPLFNPRLNFRNHRKIVIIDGTISYVGGFNVGNEYLGIDPTYGYWRDTHSRIEGSATHELQTRFLIDWNMAAKHARVAYDEAYYPAIPRRGTTAVQIVSSGPDSDWDSIKNSYIKMILSAKKYVYIQTPYFVPDDAVMEAIRIASLTGVDVRIMIPAVPDHKIVYWATMSYMDDLLRAGAKVDLYEKGFIHAKTVVIDDEVATCGTTNFDVRSFSLNFEVNAFFLSGEKAYEMRKIYERDLGHSRALTLADYENRSLKKRFQESIARLISPIL